MPKQHSKHTKMDALIQLEYGNSISTVHFATGIPTRTLYRWRAERNRKRMRTARKTSHIATKSPQNTDHRHESPDSRQSSPESRHKNPHIDHQLPENCHNSDSQSDQTANNDVEDFAFIRKQLMQYARSMAADLLPNDPDINRRTLALSRVLDRIQWIDKLLPDHLPEQVIRIEYLYDGKVHDLPPWHGASQGNPRMTTEDFTDPGPSPRPPNPDDADQPEHQDDPSHASFF